MVAAELIPLVSRAAARKAGANRYFTAKPCSKGHIAERIVSNFECVVCHRNRAHAYRKATPERQKKENRRTYLNRVSTPEKRAAWKLRIYRTRRGTPERRTKENQRRKKLCRLQDALRNRLYCAVHNNQRAGSAIRNLGCTIPEFRAHIEALFRTGMSWNNWGVEGWHLDHIRPLAAFDLTDPAQFAAACHFTNYQPLWAADNLRKGASL